MGGAGIQTMISSLLTAAALLFADIPAFCAGYNQGFTSAYCQGHLFCKSASVPACPSMDATWREGYDRGYDDGEKVHPPHTQKPL